MAVADPALINCKGRPKAGLVGPRSGEAKSSSPTSLCNLQSGTCGFHLCSAGTAKRQCILFNMRWAVSDVAWVKRSKKRATLDTAK